MLFSGCGATDYAEIGDKVQLDYTLTLDDGSIYYTTIDDEPGEYELGSGDLIPGAEEAVIGMKVTERKTVSITPDMAFGPVQPELIQEVDIGLMPEGFEPAVGKELMTEINGTPLSVVIREITDTTVTVDANHPLAGQNLNLDVMLLDLIKPVATETGLGGQPVVVWVLSGALLLLAAAFVLFFIQTQRRFKRIMADPRARKSRTT